MKFSVGVGVRAFALVASLVLAGCGGGGGGGTTAGAGGSTAAPQAVTITESNAVPVAANALDAAQSTSAGQLPVGVEIQAGGRAPNYFSTVARAIQLASSTESGATLATGVTTTQACPMGGSFTMTGDTITRTLNFIDCKLSADAVTMSGSLSVTLISGSTGTMPFHAVVSVGATNFSMASPDGSAVSLSGDMRMDMTVSSTSQTFLVSGSSLSTRFTEGAATYTTTLKSYSQTMAFNGFVVSSSLSATVESTSTRLGAGGGTYTVTTLTPVVQDYSTDVFTAGVVKVVGAGGSQLAMTVGINNTVTIEVDANGDGTFEKTISSTVSELEALL